MNLLNVQRSILIVLLEYEASKMLDLIEKKLFNEEKVD